MMTVTIISQAEIHEFAEGNIMKSRLFGPVSTFMIILLMGVAGCGGSSGGGGTTQTLISLTTSDIRTYMQGDMLTASLTVKDTATGNTASGDITITVGGIVQNPFGIDCRSVVYSGTLTGPAGTIAYSVRGLFFQDNNNSLYDCGEFNDTLGRYVFLTDTAETPNGVFLESKSPVALGDTTSGVAFYDDGTWQDCTRTVLAIENVSTPMGLYESYKISESCSYSDGTQLVSTLWNVPDIFNIKESGVADGLSLELVIKSATLN